MKYLLLISMLLLFSCRDIKEKERELGESKITNEVYSVDVDSCEYVVFDGFHNGGIVHKQNCKYCKSRKQ